MDNDLRLIQQNTQALYRALSFNPDQGPQWEQMQNLFLRGHQRLELRQLFAFVRGKVDHFGQLPLFAQNVDQLLQADRDAVCWDGTHIRSLKTWNFLLMGVTIKIPMMSRSSV